MSAISHANPIFQIYCKSNNSNAMYSMAANRNVMRLPEGTFTTID